MADTHADGIDAMRARMARGRRVPPAARARPPQEPPHAATAGDPPTGPGTPPAGAPDPGEGTRATGRPARATRPRRPARPAGIAVPADAPPVNLAIRVRRPLDDHLVDRLHDLRRAGVRSSKVEVIEMLLWELAADDGDLAARLAAFRAAAPRPAHAPIG